MTDTITALMKKDHECAFPYMPHNDQGLYDHQKGMSLRDWFAGQALAGQLANPNNLDGMHDVYAVDAYRYADAMLEQRGKQKHD